MTKIKRDGASISRFTVSALFHSASERDRAPRTTNITKRKLYTVYEPKVYFTARTATPYQPITVANTKNDIDSDKNTCEYGTAEKEESTAMH